MLTTEHCPFRSKVSVAIRAFAAAILFISGSAVSTSISPAKAADLRSCVIEASNGQNEFRENGSWRAAAAGDVLNANTRLRTGPNGRIYIVCSDKVTVTLGADTEIGFEKLVAVTQTESAVARLARGIAGFIVPLLGEARFEVRTPEAVASVRSTEWTVDASDAGTSVFVREGVVVVSGTNTDAEPVLLSEGDGVDVTAATGTGPVRQWSANRIEAMNGRLGFDWQ
ncbi:MAG: FecR family protein [Pseudomonadota bacterium]